MTTTTQPASTRSVEKGASGIFEGILFLFGRPRQRPTGELTRDESIREIVKALGCNCRGTCGSCQHVIKDVLGD